MVNPLDPYDVASYLARWKLVNAHERTALRQSTHDLRFRQLSALFGAHMLFAFDPERERKIEEVRGRWQRIREAMSA